MVDFLAKVSDRLGMQKGITKNGNSESGIYAYLKNHDWDRRGNRLKLCWSERIFRPSDNVPVRSRGRIRGRKEAIMEKYTVETCGFHDSKIVSRHKKIECAFRAAKKYGRGCACGCGIVRDSDGDRYTYQENGRGGFDYFQG